MAEGDDSSPENLRNKTDAYSEYESDSEEPVKLDLGARQMKNLERATSMENSFGASTSGLNEVPKREDNPFSFKHFLKHDSTNYQSQGARPKVYCDGRPISSVSDLDLHQMTETKQTRIVPEFSSALPDFVQDHLVIEQCYLGGKDTHKNYNLEVDNLPDFTQSGASVHINRINVDSSRDIDRRYNNSTNSPVPLDLPIRPQVEFPLDLPVNEAQGTSRSCPSTAEVGVSKSLPDFLADGAVQGRTNENIGGGQSPDREIDRLRQDLELCRRQLSDETRRGDFLQQELDIIQSREHDYTQNLAKALEQVEENLERSNKRVACAENTITKLKQEIKVLKNENNKLKRESRYMKDEEGAAGGPRIESNEEQAHKLAHELRTAANTAEYSLKQLLKGLENLHIMASSIENLHRIEEREDNFDFNHDEADPSL